MKTSYVDPNMNVVSIGCQYPDLDISIRLGEPAH